MELRSGGSDCSLFPHRSGSGGISEAADIRVIGGGVPNLLGAGVIPFVAVYCGRACSGGNILCCRIIGDISVLIL